MAGRQIWPFWLRKFAENRKETQGFSLLCAVGGGISFGMGSLLLVSFLADYGRKFVLRCMLISITMVRTEASKSDQQNPSLDQKKGEAETVCEQQQKGAPFIFSSANHTIFDPQIIGNPLFQLRSNPFQIFIRPPVGKSQLVWVHEDTTIMQLKQKIWGLMGYPVPIQHLVNGHNSLQDCKLLKDYAIKT